MTPEEIARVEGIIDEATSSDEFATRFYTDLFVLAPETKAMFPDLDAQREKLRDELASLGHLIRNHDQLEIEATALGARHRGYGVRAAHYRLARSAMETALAETLGDRFGPAELAAWRQAYDVIAELMQA